MDKLTVSIILILSFIQSFEVTLAFLHDASNSDVSVVKVRLSEEKSKRLLLQNDVEALMLKTEELERQIKKLTANLPQSGHSTLDTTVHFNVKLSKHTTLDALHVIVFDTVIDNVGEGYSPSTGIFRAPVAGLYQFSVSILSIAKNKYAHIQLIKSNSELGRVFAGDAVAAYGQMGSVTVTTHLTEGEEVFCREFPGLTGHVHGDSFSSFSGVLLSI